MIQWATVLSYFSAEKVLIEITQKVLEMPNRIIFSADSGILANQVILYCVFARLGISIKELFSKLFPDVISVVRVEKSTLFLYIFKGKCCIILSKNTIVFLNISVKHGHKIDA